MAIIIGRAIRILFLLLRVERNFVEPSSMGLKEEN